MIFTSPPGSAYIHVQETRPQRTTANVVYGVVRFLPNEKITIFAKPLSRLPIRLAAVTLVS
jgi:hypothetical protein